jgi:hypothetical protein
VAPSNEYLEFLTRARTPEGSLAAREDLLDALKARRADGSLVNPEFEVWGLEDVWFDVPKPLSFDEANNCQVRVPSGEDGVDVIPMNSLFPGNQWSDAYAQHKLQSFVFCRPCDADTRRKVGETAKAMLLGFNLAVKAGFTDEAKYR